MQKVTFWDGSDLIDGVIINSFITNGRLSHEVNGFRNTPFGEKKPVKSITCFDYQLIKIN